MHARGDSEGGRVSSELQSDSDREWAGPIRVRIRVTVPVGLPGRRGPCPSLCSRARRLQAGRPAGREKASWPVEAWRPSGRRPAGRSTGSSCGRDSRDKAGRPVNGVGRVAPRESRSSASRLATRAETRYSAPPSRASPGSRASRLRVHTGSVECRIRVSKVVRRQRRGGGPLARNAQAYPAGAWRVSSKWPAALVVPLVRPWAGGPVALARGTCQ
jgi:hypothetical protein